MIWRCPVCSAPLHTLENNPRKWSCVNGHTFDQAKEGYLNLLLSRAKGAKKPGDSREMVSARRRFLEAGFYEPLVTHLANWVVDETAHKPSATWLDVGCGEGYYLRSLWAEFNKSAASTRSLNYRWFGLDISKEAIKRAAKSIQRESIQRESIQCQFMRHLPVNNKGESVSYVVASSFSMPVVPEACDGVFQIFAPASDEELCRVLKPDGKLIRVGPGPNHMREIKEAIYEHPQANKMSESPSGFKQRKAYRLTYSIELGDRHQIQDLIAMTPFHWKGSRQAKTALIERDCLRLTLDFNIQAFDKM